MTTEKAKLKRPQKSAEERRHDIVAAASELFAEHGFQSTDTQTVADKAGVGKGTLYRNFKSKEELFKATLDMHLDELRATVVRARESEQDPLEKLRATWLAYIGFFEQNNNIIELFIEERLYFRDQERSLYFTRLERSRDEWRALFEDILRVYPNDEVTASELMDISGQLVHGAVLLSQHTAITQSTQQRVDLMMRIFMHGFIKPGQDNI
ncbi:TetR/AcrR family transcriptional regulator [Aliidiomarina soli]|uniref:TetR family transcriptional regulator n=1 Tax=Aliidiomarina soli TaxID=1928574 RepID=A0A432WLU0_9GAMM|nr:TetR/AcrR family transcriptional regulator [Aliidiomarina soli]RUO34780.1 TetR family transcriptional regulator [Aliidiomarina soli]